MLGDALGQRRNGQQRIHSQRGGDQRSVGYAQALEQRAVVREDLSELVYGPGSRTLADGTASQRMGGHQAFQTQRGPRRILDESRRERPGMLAQAVVDGGENRLGASATPDHVRFTFGVADARLQLDLALGIVECRNQVDQRMVEGAVLRMW